MALLQCLKEAQLEQYYNNFRSCGITQWDHLSAISMDQYSRFGICSMEDRLRLFRLVQVVKIVQEEKQAEKKTHHQNLAIKYAGQGELGGEQILKQGQTEKINKKEEVKVSPLNPGQKRRHDANDIVDSSVVFDCRKTLTFSDCEDEAETSPRTNKMSIDEKRKTDAKNELEAVKSSTSMNISSVLSLVKPKSINENGVTVRKISPARNSTAHSLPTKKWKSEKDLSASQSGSSHNSSAEKTDETKFVIKQVNQSKGNLSKTEMKGRRPLEVGVKGVPAKKIMRRKYRQSSSSESDTSDSKKNTSALRKISKVSVRKLGNVPEVKEKQVKVNTKTNREANMQPCPTLQTPKETTVKTGRMPELLPAESSSSATSGTSEKATTSTIPDNSIPVSLLRRLNINSGSNVTNKNNANSALIIEPIENHAYFPKSNSCRTSKSDSEIKTIVHGEGYNYGVPHGTVNRHCQGSSPSKTYVNQRIKVCIRKRPLSKKEVKDKETDIVQKEGLDTVVIQETKSSFDMKKYVQKHAFVFDEMFSEADENESVYQKSVKPMIIPVFNKQRSTVFCFGQTGSGKTHTLLGSRSQLGLCQLASQDLFSTIKSGTYGSELQVWVSYYELYKGQLYDLLNARQKLHVRDNAKQRVCIAGLMETQATDAESFKKVVEYGNASRSTGSSGANSTSSRSHAVLQLEIRGARDQRVGRLSFIDLAGSERAADMTEVDRHVRNEGAEINQSLLALKECIRSLDQDTGHTPYRQSKLTRILKDSFTGNSLTCMIANISPGQSNCDSTLNTLRYADRVRAIGQSTSVPNLKDAENEENKATIHHNNRTGPDFTWGSCVLVPSESSESTQNSPDKKGKNRISEDDFIDNPLYRRKSLPVFASVGTSHDNNGNANHVIDMVRHMNQVNQPHRAQSQEVLVTHPQRTHSQEVIHTPRQNQWNQPQRTQSHEVIRSPNNGSVKTPQGSSSGFSEPTASSGGSGRSPTKPSLFHPSIIQGSSTPMSSPYKSGMDHTTPGTEEDPMTTGYESPIIRGHRVKKMNRRKSVPVGKENLHVNAPPIKLNFDVQPDRIKSPESVKSPKELVRFAINGTQVKRMKPGGKAASDSSFSSQDGSSPRGTASTSRVVIDGRKRVKGQTATQNGMSPRRASAVVQQNGIYSETLAIAGDSYTKSLQKSEVSVTINQNGVATEVDGNSNLQKSDSVESLNGYDNVDMDNNVAKATAIENNLENSNHKQSDGRNTFQELHGQVLENGVQGGYHIEPMDPVLRLSGVADMSPSVITKDSVRYQALKRHNEIMSQVDQILNRAMESLKKTSSPPAVTSPNNLISPRSVYASQEFLKIPSPQDNDPKERSTSAPDPSKANNSGQSVPSDIKYNSDVCRLSETSNSDAQQSGGNSRSSSHYVMTTSYTCSNSNSSSNDLTSKETLGLAQSIQDLNLNDIKSTVDSYVKNTGTGPVQQASSATATAMPGIPSDGQNKSTNSQISLSSSLVQSGSMERISEENGKGPRSIQESVQFIRNQLKEMEANSNVSLPKETSPVPSRGNTAFKPYKGKSENISVSFASDTSLEISSMERLRLPNGDTLASSLSGYTSHKHILKANVNRETSVGVADAGSTLIPKSICDSEHATAFSQLSDISSELSKISGMLENVSVASTSSLLNAKPDQMSSLLQDSPLTNRPIVPLSQVVTSSIASLKDVNKFNIKPAETTNHLSSQKLDNMSLMKPANETVLAGHLYGNNIHMTQPNNKVSTQTVMYKNSPIKTEKLGVLNPLALFSPIQTFPTTARESDMIVTPSIITKTIVQESTSEHHVSVAGSGEIEEELVALGASGARCEVQQPAKLVQPQPKKAEVQSTQFALSRARNLVVSAHEEQLSEMTNKCKQEMQLLMAMKNGHINFEDYLKQLQEILNSKWQCIGTFRSHIDQYKSLPDLH